MQDALNGVLSRIVELIENDERLQAHLRRHHIDYGWERPTWEQE
jgi:hypothetical protein